jgi:hypothetical protein
MIRKVVGSLVDAAEQALAADSPVSGPYSQLSRRAAEAQRSAWNLKSSYTCKKRSK